MRKSIIGLVVLGLLALPAMGQNLLLNPGFDEAITDSPGGTGQPANDPISERDWLGFFSVDGWPNVGCTEPCDPFENSYGARSWPLEPNSGTQYWQVSASGGLIEASTYQTVAVSSGSTVTLNGLVQTGPATNGELNTVTFTVYDNDAVGGTVIGFGVYDQTNTNQGAWTAITPISGMSNSGHVTVEWTAQVDAPFGFAGAVHIEDMELTSSTACSGQITLDEPQGFIGTHDENKLIQITGTNMTNVTGVKLVQVATETIVSATLGTQTATTVDATVQVAAEAAPLGLYNVVVEQADCVTQVLYDAYEVTCANETVFTEVIPDSVTEGDAGLNSIVLTVKGTGLVAPPFFILPELSNVRLTLGGLAIVATNVQVAQNGQDLDVTFDLSSAPAGNYQLRATRDDACNNPAPAQLFTINSSVPRVNVLFNGGFDDFGPQADNTTIPSGHGWFKYVQTTGFDLRYNETLNGMPGPHGGDNYGGVHTGNGDNAHGVNVVTGLTPGQNVVLTGAIGGCSNGGEGDRDYQHRIILWDWDATSQPLPADTAELGRFMIDTADKCSGQWIPFSFSATVPSSGTVTVDFGYWRMNPGWAIPATHADEIQLLVPEPCPKPYGDADQDGDIDAEDFGRWQKCFTGTGPGTPFATGECLCFDADGDQLIGQTDYQAFSGCATGPGILQTDDDCGVIQACCTGATCTNVSKANCEAAGGVPQGEGTDCVTTTCP